MKNLKKLTALAGICAVTVASLAACGQSGTTTETKADTNAAQTEAGSQAAESTADSAKDTQAASEASADLSGSITMAGSTSMEKLRCRSFYGEISECNRKCRIYRIFRRY